MKAPVVGHFPIYKTKSCPKNKSEWTNRSSSLKCTKLSGYMCLPNENITELLEFCYKYPQTLIPEGKSLRFVLH